MKKTININLGNRAFYITEEAYYRLEDYLNSISACFKNNEYGEEIAGDIESRISELCAERLQQSRVEIIDLALVNEMINRMGKPETMIDGSEETPDEKTAEEKQAHNDEKDIFDKLRLNKKYYLDSNDRMVGGVISGLSAYFKIDVTLLRVIAAILIISTGLFGIILYLVIWCIAPTANTTTDKLRMQGIEPTPEKIAEKITGEEPCDTPKEPEEKEKRENRKKFLLAGAIILAAVILGPKVTITGNAPIYYIFGYSVFATFILLFTLLALKITKLLNNKIKKIIITLIIITSLTALLTFLFTQIPL